jgi:hypothetical protein
MYNTTYIQNIVHFQPSRVYHNYTPRDPLTNNSPQHKTQILLPNYAATPQMAGETPKPTRNLHKLKPKTTNNILQCFANHNPPLQTKLRSLFRIP